MTNTMTIISKTLCFRCRISLLLLLLLFSLQLPRLQAVSVVLTVPAGEEECYMVRVPFHSTVHGNYNILEDHLRPDQVVVFVAEAESGKRLYSSKFGKDHGSFQLKDVETKRFQVCVQNSVASRKRKFDTLERNVGLSIEVEPPSSDHFDEKTRALQDYSEKVYSAVNDLAGHFKFRKMRESKHRQLVEQIFVELLQWTVAEGVFVALLALGQITYLRKAVSRYVY